MFFVVVACGLLSVVADDSNILNYENTNDGSGNYRFSYLTSNGISREETGRLVNVGESNEHVAVEGSYTYTDPDGKDISVKYTADENGYHIIDTAQQDRIDEFPISAPPLSSNVVASLLGK